MDSNALLVSLPATAALLLKVGIFVYARFSSVQNQLARLYMYFLLALSIQNIAEISHFYTLSRGAMPHLEFTIYYAAITGAIALLLHLALAVSFADNNAKVKAVLKGIYFYAVVLAGLFIFSSLMIADLSRMGVTATRVPGPLYPLFEVYAIGGFLGTIGILLYGSRRRDIPFKKRKAAIMLLAIVPMAVVIIGVLVLLRLNIRIVNATIINPIAIGYFLVVTAYAIHNHRLFDIRFYIPWSKVRQRKTAFYGRIRAMIAEIADLGAGSVSQVLDRLSDTLRCPAALVGGPKPISVAGADILTGIPLHLLRGIDEIVVANEVEDTRPAIYAAMKRHHIAAIVPFYPHNQNAASWLLLGDSFSEQVYTPLDFHMVEQLFDKMAELFLDKLLAMRSQLADAHQQIQTLEFRMRDMEHALTAVRGQIDVLNQENARLRREQPADSLLAASRQALTPVTVTVLGRDKQLLGWVRRRFPQAESYAGADSASFRRKTPPTVLVAHLDGTATAERRLLSVLTTTHRDCAALLCGPGAAAFGSNFRRELAGMPVEVPPPGIVEDALLRKVGALAELRRSLYSIDDADYPLLGHTMAFRELMAEARRVAGFRDPVFVKTADVEEGVALGRYLHDHGGDGQFVLLRAAHVARAEAAEGGPGAMLDSLLHSARGGTFMVDNLGALPNELWDQLLAKSNNFAETHLVVGNSIESSLDPAALLKPLHALVLELPPLRERRGDIPLLVHHFTLQFNLQGGTHQYLTQAETDDLLHHEFPRDLHALKASVYHRLSAKDAANRVAEPSLDLAHTDKTLDECVAEFETRLIAQTLKRCNGNKSKAVRLLGLRPNTLHYKLERYGIKEEKKSNDE